MKRKILIIGTGGIGSFLIPLLDKTKLYKITANDPDIIEKKNISYQNFESEEVELKKVQVMKNRYPSIVKAEPFLVLTEKQIEGYDLVICCADNLDVRRLLYRSSCQWLDLRAQGRNGAYISYKKVMSGMEVKRTYTLLMSPLQEWPLNGFRDGS